MISLKQIYFFVVFMIIISVSKTEKENYGSTTETETTTTSEAIDEKSDEETNDNFDSDYESHNNVDYDDRYPADINTINTDEINSVINRIVKRLSPSDEEEEVPVKVELKNTTINDTLNLMLEFHELFSNSIEAFFKIVMPVFLKYFYEFEISDQCSSSLFKMINGIRSQKVWPLKFLDASAKIPSGLLDGTISDYGQYEQCLNIKVTEEESLTITGKYCMTLISMPIPPKPEKLYFHKPILNVSETPLENTIWEIMANNMNMFYISKGFRAGLCIPSACSAQELQSIADKILQPMLRLKLKIGPNCDTRDDKIPFTTHQIVAISILTTLSCIAITATFIEMISNISNYKKQNLNQNSNIFEKNSLFMRIMMSFSLIKNTHKLLQSDTYTKRLSVIHGIRFLAITWILIGHVYLMQFFQIFHVLMRIIGDMPKIAWYRYQPLKLGSFLQVETFLLLGGLTASYVTLEVLKNKNQPFNYYAFVLVRWLRYTPNLIGVILFYILMPHLGSGPIFKENIELMYKPCEQFWWRNLLYINNFYDATGNCATHTWYLAVDFQLYILSPIIFLTLMRSQLIGLFGTIIIIIGSTFLCIIPSIMFDNISPAMYTFDAILEENIIYDHFLYLYWATYQHIAPYYIGILVGYLVHKYENIHIWKPIEIVLWIVCFTSGFYTIFWTTSWMDSEAETETPERFHRLVFTAVHKITWIMLPAWIIFINAMGRAGIIGKFLSWKVFIPLSRLTYGIYLVQLMPIILRSYSVKYVMPFDDFYNMSVSCLCLLLSIILSYILYVLFESPFGNLVKILTEKLENTLINDNMNRTMNIDLRHIEVIDSNNNSVSNTDSQTYSITKKHIVDNKSDKLSN